MFILTIVYIIHCCFKNHFILFILCHFLFVCLSVIKPSGYNLHVQKVYVLRSAIHLFVLFYYSVLHFILFCHQIVKLGLENCMHIRYYYFLFCFFFRFY